MPHNPLVAPIWFGGKIDIHPPDAVKHAAGHPRQQATRKQLARVPADGFRNAEFQHGDTCAQKAQVPYEEE